MKMRKLFSLVLFATLLSTAHGASLIWTNGTGNFSDGTKWNTGTAPLNGDSTVFTNNSAYTVNFTAGSVNNSNFVNGGTVTFDIGAGNNWILNNNNNASTGLGALSIGAALNSTATVFLASGTLTVTNTANTANLVVGGNGSGTFFVTNGTVVASFTKLGATATGQGALIVSGLTTYFTNNSTFFIGQANGSTGNSLTISNAASMTVNSTFTLGNTGAGGNSLLIGSGGRLFTRSTVAVGNGSSNNLARILGDGVTASVWNNGGTAFTVGSAAATGNVVVIDGGGLAGGAKLTNVTTWTIGSGATNSGNSIVVKNGGQLWATGFNIGVSGSSNNSLVIDGGSQVSASSTIVSNGQSVLGTVGSGGNSILITNGTLIVSGGFFIGTSSGGGSSNNTVTVLANGVLKSFGAQGLNIAGTSIGNTPAANNSIKVDGGTLISENNLVVGGMTNVVQSTLYLSNGAALLMASSALQIGLRTSSNNTVYLGGGVGMVFSTNSTTTVGGGGSYNTLIATNARWVGDLIIGNGSSSNTVSILSGAVSDNSALKTASLIVGSGASAVSNTLVIDGGGVTGSAVSSNANFLQIGYDGSANNALIVTNGGLLRKRNSQYAAVGDGGNSNALIVAGGTVGAVSMLELNGMALRVGNLSDTGNVVRVDGGGIAGSAVISNGAITVGNAANAIGNQVIVTNGGKIFSGNVIVGNAAGANSNVVTLSSPNSIWQMEANTLTVGAANNTGNVVQVFAGGVLEGNSLATGNAGAGNAITNSGGVYQFTSTTMTVTTNGGVGSIAIDNGIISFRGLTGVNLTNNWRGTQLTRLTWSGNNTLRLDNTAGTNTLAGGYNFDTGLGATNYSRLELLNGTTAVAGTGLTIGNNGALVISGTTATISGPVTNYGSTTVTSSGATFSRGLYNTNSLTLNNGTIFSAVTNVAGGTLQGNGFIVGNLTNDAILSPGFAVGTLSITGSVSLGANSLVLLELAAPGSNDLIVVSGSLAYGGTLTVTNSTGFMFAAGQTYQLFQFGGHVSGSEFSITNLPDVTALNLQWNTTALDSAGSITLTLIPEPSSLVLVAAGLGLLIALRQKHRHS